MSEQVQLVNIPTDEDLNKSEIQSRESIDTNSWNDKLAEIRKASRKRDKFILALTVILLICSSLAVTVVVIYMEHVKGKRFFLYIRDGRIFFEGNRD